MTEVIDVDQRTKTLSTYRKVVKELAGKEGIDLSKYESQAYINYGPDWVSYVSNWFTAWERTGDEKYLNYIKTGMKSFLDMPHGFFTSPFYVYDADTKKIYDFGVQKTLKADKLSMIMGGFEIMTEVVKLVDYPEFDELWVEYCRRYNWSTSDWKKYTGLRGKFTGEMKGHSRLTAYAAWRKNDPEMAKRAWDELLYSRHDYGVDLSPQQSVHISGSDILNPSDEVATATSNRYSQWSLAVMANLELAGDQLPEKIKKKK